MKSNILSFLFIASLFLTFSCSSDDEDQNLPVTGTWKLVNKTKNDQPYFDATKCEDQEMLEFKGSKGVALTTYYTSGTECMMNTAIEGSYQKNGNQLTFYYGNEESLAQYRIKDGQLVINYSQDGNIYWSYYNRQ